MSSVGFRCRQMTGSGIEGNAAVAEVSPKNRSCDTKSGWGTPSGIPYMRGSAKADVVPIPLFPLVGPAEQRDRYHHTEPPAPRPPAASLPGPRPPPCPPYRPASHGLRGGSETAPPLRSRSLGRREALRCYTSAAAVVAAAAREREGGGGLASGHARK